MIRNTKSSNASFDFLPIVNILYAAAITTSIGIQKSINIKWILLISQTTKANDKEYSKIKIDFISSIRFQF